MRTLADVFVKVRADTKTLGPDLKRQVEKDAGSAGAASGRKFTSGMEGEVKPGAARAAKTHSETYKKSFLSGFSGVGKAMAASFVVAGAVSLFGGMIGEAREAEKVTRLTESAIKATGGAAGVSAGEVGKLADSIARASGVDDELIQSGANLLLTFKDIKNSGPNKIFDEATLAATDMTAAMNNGVVSQEGLKSSSIQIGKALNDPLKGMKALTKVGVTFNDQQREQIKTMVESGDKMGAQKIILAELNSEFGGAAAAAADPAQKAGVAWENFKETLGTAVLPMVQNLANAFASAAPWISEHIGLISAVAGAIVGLILVVKTYQLISAAASVVTGIATFATSAWAAATGAHTAATGTSTAALAGHKLGIIAHNVVSGIAKGAVLAWAGAQWVLNAALHANPIGLIIVAIVALVAVFILAWKNSETFRNIVIGAWNGIKVAVAATVSWFMNTAWPGIRSALEAIGRAAISLWNNLQPTFRLIGGVIMWLWHNVVENAVRGIRIHFDLMMEGGRRLFAIIGPALGQLGAVLMWLWRNVVLNAVTGIRILFDQLMDGGRRLFTIIGPAIGQLASVLTWLWRNIVVNAINGIRIQFDLFMEGGRRLFSIIGPVLGKLAEVIMWLWHNVVENAVKGMRLQFDLFMAAGRRVFEVVGPVLGKLAEVVMWLWHNVFENAFRGIKVAVELAVNFILGTLWPRMRTGFDVLKGFVTDAWHSFQDNWNLIKGKVESVIQFFTQTIIPNARDAFSNIKGFVTDLYNAFREKFDLIKTKVDAIMAGVKSAFEGTKNAIKTTWDQIKEAVRTPINYVINPVYAKIKDFWNAISSKIPGIGNLPDIAQMASGGVYPGYTPGRDIGMIGVSGGEAVMRPEWTRVVGEGEVHRQNRIARTGGVSAIRRYMGGYADGGVVGALGNIGGFLKGKGEEFALGSILRIAGPIIAGIRSLIGGIPSRGGTLGQMVKGIPTLLLDKAIEFIKTRDVAPIPTGEGGSLGTGGRSIEKIIELAKQSKIPFNVTSTYRAGDPLYHGSGRAVDFGGFNQDRFANFWMGLRSSLLELIHRSNSKDYGVSNGRLWSGTRSNDALLQAHRNHVHVAMNGNAVIGTGGGPGGPQVSGTVAGWIRTALAREGVANWQTWMETLVKRESGGNRFAQSFSSNGPLGYAIGLAQLLSSTFAAYRDRSLPNDRTDPIANLVSSIRYIKSRYGSIFNVSHANPSGSPNPGGYAGGGIVGRFDRGGLVPPGGWMYNGGRTPELATPTDQPIRLHRKDLEKLGEIIGSHVARAIGTFGMATARSADLIARS